MKIHGFKDYSVEEFIEEDLFRRWVIENDKSLDFFWHRYTDNYPEQAAKLEEAKQILETTYTHFLDKETSISKPSDDFKSRLTQEFNSELAKHDVPSSIPNKLFHRLAIAASVLLVIGFSSFFFMEEKSSSIEYVTGNAEWKKVTLPDGSIVELNANSQLSLTEEWEDGVSRRVWLKGEAFFKVKKIPSTQVKFTVITKDLEVDVLGTTFNVNTRNDHTEVFLEEGIITLDLQGRKEQIKPGEFISYSQATKKIIDRYKETEEIHSKWKDGVLNITDASMKDILYEVESIYGIDLIVTDKTLLEKVGSVAIPVDNLDMATSILERVLNVKMERKGKQVFIN